MQDFGAQERLILWFDSLSAFGHCFSLCFRTTAGLVRATALLTRVRVGPQHQDGHNSAPETQPGVGTSMYNGV